MIGSSIQAGVGDQPTNPGTSQTETGHLHLPKDFSEKVRTPQVF
jgi:hypothetical protein